MATSVEVGELIDMVFTAARRHHDANRRMATEKELQELARSVFGRDTRNGDGAKLMRVYSAIRWMLKVHTGGE